ncbi:MAG: HAMP domain-containing sensor histidine kinase [Candidatus Paceibacterota bacterium]
MQYFDVYNCEVVENSLIVSYQNSVLLLSVLWMFILTIKELFIKNEKKSEKTKTVLLALGLSSMLFSLFFTWNPTIFGYSAGFEEFGFIGMIVFLVTVTYMVVKYKAFNIKLLATQALIWGLIALIGSQFFFIRTPINRVLNGITFAASIILGYYLVKSVKKEIEQRKQLAFLLKQRESLVHLITHKVKGSFTRIKFLFAGMLDGTFGEISSEIKKRAEQGLEFDDNGIQTVDLVLNVANMQNGLIKYDMKTTDFRNLVEETISEKKISAEKKGLVIETKIEDGTYSVTGDSFWLKEVVNNLLENSIKYTKEGKIMVDLKKHNNKILFSVKDNGVGINEEDKKHLFTEGGRGAKSVEINVDSTGYGLFTVKLIVDAHAGRVWAESEGENKGSQFYVELPTI